MEAIQFQGQNLILAESQEQYNPLPVCYEGPPQGAMTACFKATWKERLKILFFGKIFVSQYTFGNSFHPINITTTWKEPICGRCGHYVSAHQKPMFLCPVDKEPSLN